MAKIRRKDIYPEQVPVDPEDYVIGTQNKDGKTKNFTVSGIAVAISDILGLDSINDGLISLEDILQDGLNFTVINAVWKLVGVEYSVAEATTQTEPASEGYYRIDYIVGDADSNVFLLIGNEDQENAVGPIVPNNVVVLGIINVFGGEANLTPAPITDYLRKSGEAQSINFLAGGTNFGYTWGNKNMVRFNPISNLTLHSVKQTIQYMYDGRDYYIKNNSQTNKTITIKHLSVQAEGNTLFFIPTLQDLIIPAGYIAFFKYYAATATTGRLELVSLFSPSSANSKTGTHVPVTIATTGTTFGAAVLAGAVSVDMISSQISGNIIDDFTFNSTTGIISGLSVVAGEKYIVFYTK